MENLFEQLSQLLHIFRKKSKKKSQDVYLNEQLNFIVSFYNNFDHNCTSDFQQEEAAARERCRKILSSVNRQKSFKELFDDTKAPNHNHQNYRKIYKNYRIFALILQKLNEKDDSKKKYSKFHEELKNATLMSNQKVTKFERKIITFNRFFNYFPAGGWAVCEIPVTYWNLIKDAYWETLMDLLEKNKKNNNNSLNCNEWINAANDYE